MWGGNGVGGLFSLCKDQLHTYTRLLNEVKQPYSERLVSGGIIPYRPAQRPIFEFSYQTLNKNTLTSVRVAAPNTNASEVRYIVKTQFYVSNDMQMRQIWDRCKCCFWLWNAILVLILVYNLIAFKFFPGNLKFYICNIHLPVAVNTFIHINKTYLFLFYHT